MGGVGLWDAGAIGQAQGGLAGARLHQQAVRVAVVAALELYDLVTRREGAGQPEGGHGGLGAGVDEADEFNRRDSGADGAGQLHLQLRRGAVGGAASGGGDERLCDGGMGMPQDQRAKRRQVIDVCVPVHIENAGALPVGDDRRVAADRLEGADWAGDSAGHVAPGQVAQLTGAGRARVAVDHQLRALSPRRSRPQP